MAGEPGVLIAVPISGRPSVGARQPSSPQSWRCGGAGGGVEGARLSRSTQTDLEPGLPEGDQL